MAAFKANINGLSRVIERINQTNKNLATGVDKIFAEGAQNIAANAKAAIPPGIEMEELAETITVDTAIAHNYVIGSDRVLAAYVEFGTGANVFDSSFPFTDEQKTYARTFYVNGKGRTHSQPFLFPALTAEIPKILGKVRNLLFGDI